MDPIVIIVLVLAAVIGGGLTAWGMWLEHRQARRVLDIVAATLEAGREPPPDLLASLVGPRGTGPEAGPRRRGLLRAAVFFLAVAGACLLASWLAHDAPREQALLTAAVATGLAGGGLLLIQVLGGRPGR